ncbi:MAG: hypothetical protein R3F24_10870 [Gammaproteobacteria bacterium]
MGQPLKSAMVLAFSLALAACGGGGGGSDDSGETISYTVTASGSNVGITLVSAQSVASGGQSSFSVVAVPGYTRDNTVAGTCAAGSWAAAVYTTGPVTANCTVTFSATINSLTVTPSGTNVSVSPGTPQAVDFGGTTMFTVTADSGYTRTNAVGGSCTAGTWAGAVYTTGAVTQDCTVSFSAGSNPVLTVSAPALALSTSGASRTLTISNSGGSDALAVGYTANLPAGSTIAPAACGTIAAGNQCVLTITPGATPSAAPGDVSPVPVTLSASGSNTNTVTAQISVVGFGSVYQSGYLFAIDDTTPGNESIAGTVAAITDQASPASGPDAVSWADSTIVIQGVSEASTSPPDTCNGNRDGQCNTTEIVAANSPPRRVPGVDPTTYAAGVCTATMDGYSDWYLPAICEMGYDSSGAGTGCGTQGAPLRQTMQANLVDNGNIGNLAGNYWSSTQDSVSPAQLAWHSFFASGGGSAQLQSGRGNLLGVRCVRAVTP